MNKPKKPSGSSPVAVPPHREGYVGAMGVCEERIDCRMWGVFVSDDDGAPLAMLRHKEAAQEWHAAQSGADLCVLRVDMHASFWNGPDRDDPWHDRPATEHAPLCGPRSERPPAACSACGKSNNAPSPDCPLLDATPTDVAPVRT